MTSEPHYLQPYDMDLANPTLLPTHAKLACQKARATLPPRMQRLPLVRMFSLQMEGCAKAVYVYDAVPYCYLEAPSAGVTEHQLSMLAQYVEALVEAPVVGCELVRNRLDMSYFQPAKDFIKVSIADPTKIKKLRNIVLGCKVQLTGTFDVCGMKIKRQMWECNVQFYRRVCIDIGIVPFGWMRVSADAVTSACGNHIFARCDQIEALGWKGEHSHVSPALRVSAFDIECIHSNPEKHDLPDGRHDPCICISVVTYLGDACSKLFDSVCFVVRAGTQPDVAPVAPPDTPPEEASRFRVVVCPDERTMLVTFSTYIREVARPTVLTGYNIDRFDWKFLLARASVFSVMADFEFMCALAPHDKMTLKKNEFQSRAYGRSDNMDCRIAGIIDLDAFRIYVRQEKLRFYSLRYVSQHFLGKVDGRVMTKKDMDHTEMPAMFHGDAHRRWTLMDYCEWDSHLVIKLIQVTRILSNYIAVARVTGVKIDELISGGQQTKVHTQLLMFSRNEILIPTLWSAPKDFSQKGSSSSGAAASKAGAASAEEAEHASLEKYTGAIVIDAEPAYHDTPITTLDFSSLYPSIMLANNLSHDTLVRTAAPCQHGHCMLRSAEVLRCGCVCETPYESSRFVTAQVRKGLLPRVLEGLLAARGVAKREMAAAEAEGDEARAATKNALQLALKVSANSVYGFSGAWLLPCLPVAASVTAFGRDMIMTTKALIERRFTKANGYVANARVIYGDTDSVMIRFGVVDRRDAFIYGKHGEGMINAFFNVDGMGKSKRAALLRQLLPPDDPLLGAVDAMEKEEQVERLTDLLCERLDEVVAAAGKLHSDVRKVVLEKVAERMLLISKKRYVMMKYTTPTGNGEVHQSGIESVRRDNSPFAANLVGQLVRVLMETGSLSTCIEIARQSVYDLTHGNVPFEQLIITKALKDRSDYKDGNKVDIHGYYCGNQPHLIVNEKRKRRGGEAYHVGDRAPYVLVHHVGQAAFKLSKGAHPKQREIVEDPVWAQAHGMLPNAGYYLKTIGPALQRIFDTALYAGATKAEVLTEDVTRIPRPKLAADSHFFAAFKRTAPSADPADTAEPAPSAKRPAPMVNSPGAADEHVARARRAASVSQRPIGSYFTVAASRRPVEPASE
jgi:DNA polymerase elongation subunit (family B)